ncbi:alpha/beta fold hydrolase [Roseicella aquatilis]|nr:alpha/beta hydrolase [Roseicella aquatilis]
MPSITVDGTPLDYAESGAGEPLVLVHGTLGDQRYWAPQMATLGRHYRVLALSLRHCWPGRWPEGDEPGGDFTIDRHVADVAGFLRALGAGPVRLVGHSRGGHIAFRVAERHPELVRALVLAEPGGELDESLGGRPGGSGAQAGAFAEGAALIGAGDIEGGLRRIAEHTGGPGAWERRSEARRAINRDNARTLLGQRHERRRPYSRAAAEAIPVPTLLVVGAETLPNFIANADALERHIPRCERVSIPRAAHSMSQDNPAGFDAAVLAFLERH